jgi:hypothetical protein
MKIMKVLLILIVCILIICVVVYTYYGGFKRLKIEIVKQGGEFVIYDTIVGEYRQSGIVMDKIYYSLLNDFKIETYKGYGKYFDNPKKVEKSKLRSEAGCIIEPKDVNNAKASSVYISKVLPEQRYIISEFPYKGKLSVLISIMKVYPALSKFAVINGFDEAGAIIEIYDIPAKKIFYRKDLRDLEQLIQ